MIPMTENLDCMRHIIELCDAKTVYNVMLTHRQAANWASTNLVDNIVALIAFCNPSTVITIQMTHKAAVSKWVEGNSLLALNWSQNIFDGFKLRHENLRQSLVAGTRSDAYYDACSQIHRFNEHIYEQTKWEGKYLDAELLEIFEAGSHGRDEGSSYKDNDDQDNSDDETEGFTINCDILSQSYMSRTGLKPHCFY